MWTEALTAQTLHKKFKSLNIQMEILIRLLMLIHFYKYPNILT
jgi:hypothetical protein